MRSSGSSLPRRRSGKSTGCSVTRLIALRRGHCTKGAAYATNVDTRPMHDAGIGCSTHECMPCPSKMQLPALHDSARGGARPPRRAPSRRCFPVRRRRASATTLARSSTSPRSAAASGPPTLSRAAMMAAQRLRRAQRARLALSRRRPSSSSRTPRCARPRSCTSASLGGSCLRVVAYCLIWTRSCIAASLSHYVLPRACLRSTGALPRRASPTLLARGSLVCCRVTDCVPLLPRPSSGGCCGGAPASAAS